jgi:hypothetical protein
VSYQSKLAAHLAEYKRTTLGIKEPGVFRYREADVLRDHILPLDHADLNLLPRARPMEGMLQSKVKRHRYFHHLNSSQAFAFNLFLPFFNGGDAASSALLRALGQGGRLKSWKLEAVPSKAEGTNIDALWVTDDGLTTICEVKLSETEFGTADSDDRHRDKLTNIYHPVLHGHVSAGALEEPAFFAAHQVLRNVWHMVTVEGSRLLFLLPRANTTLWDTLPKVLDALTTQTRKRVSVVAIEDVLDRLQGDEECPLELQAYAKELAQKYVPA